jgi:hypothetical protein
MCRPIQLAAANAGRVLDSETIALRDEESVFARHHCYRDLWEFLDRLTSIP